MGAQLISPTSGQEMKRKLVFVGGITQFSIINTDPSHRLDRSWDKLVLVIPNHSNTGLFRNNLNWADPLAIKNMVDYPII